MRCEERVGRLRGESAGVTAGGTWVLGFLGGWGTGEGEEEEEEKGAVTGCRGRCPG